MTSPSAIDVPTGVPDVRAAFTTRVGGYSTGPFAGLNLGSANGDDPAAVRANRSACARAVGFDAARAVVLHQVHGADVVTVGPEGGAGAFAQSLDGLASADASVTNADGVALLALGADCPPVLLWDASGTTIAAAHAGWRGVVAGVLEAAVTALECGAHEVRAAVGPCVGPCCYPVDGELRARMSERFGAAVVRGDAVDLRAACIAALVGAGVARDEIDVVGECTSCDAERFFSYRRDGAATGRQAGVIWRHSGAG